nr:ribonuclease H-like domain-containing protein [Tanacetum cinerariifolium]
MLQAPIEGYEDAIIVPPINANNFELKRTLINLVQSNQFTRRQDPHNHLRFVNKVTSTFRHPEVPNTTVKDVKFFENMFPFKNSKVRKNDSKNVLQDVNHINFFDVEYPEIPNDDERVTNDPNKGKSDSSSSFESGKNINTADFPIDSRNDVDSSNDYVVTHDEEVATLEEYIFFEGNLDQNPSSSQEVVYMKPPEGYFPSDNKVCRLKRSLYGLKHALRQWNAKLTSTLIENGFSQSKYDYSLYTKSDKGVFLALLVYVDDIIITGNSASEIEKFKLSLKFKIMIKDLGKLKYFRGIKVVDTDKASDKDPLLKNITDYQKLMGKLIYLTNTRPNISYVVHCLSQFMHSSLTSHLKIVFKILRYLKSCLGLGVHITKTSGMFLTAYSDADYAKCVVTRKSVTGNSAIKIAANLVFHERTKHLEIDLYFVREKVLKVIVNTVKVDSANQIADILTKGLDTVQHLELVKKW